MDRLTRIYFDNDGVKTDTIFSSGKYSTDGCDISIDDSYNIRITATEYAPRKVVLVFNQQFSDDTLFLGDAFERGYGDLLWRKRADTGYIPWYFLASDGKNTHGFGVKTGSDALCFWRISEEHIELILDIRNGSESTMLQGKTIKAAKVVFFKSDKEKFDAACEFCSLMCDDPILPASPVFGGNDWYCNYGDNSFKKIEKSAFQLAECAKNTQGIKPYMVIDDGWQFCWNPSFNGGPFKFCNSKFSDMKKMADRLCDIGTIPGIWIRPLLTKEYLPSVCCFNKRNIFSGERNHLDPSHPEVLNYIESEIKTVCSNGYKLIKFDFTTFDIFGKYAFEMDENLTEQGWHFYDRSKTTAQIIKNLYKAIRKAVTKDTLIIGCNTIGHLGAGLFEIQRTGDDTSGREWERTRKMGVNTLAFRMPQHRNFFASDADCVGITDKIPWDKNAQWLHLLSQSGTPLFVSADVEFFNAQHKEAVTRAFETVTKTANMKELLRPIDWETNLTPEIWERNGDKFKYRWY